MEGQTNGVQPGAVVAVGKVQDSLPTPDLKGVRALVDSQTKSIGVIQPPPDIRAIVDKTAQFVAKNGKSCPLFTSTFFVFTVRIRISCLMAY